MVAHATTSPLPQLSPEDKRLLRIYFRVGQSIQALADELISLDAINRSSPDSPLPIPHSPLPDEFDLSTWATSETIAPHINYRKQELADARREEALKELTSLVKHSDSPLERRRAATTLLRMLSNQLHRGRAAAAPSSPSGGGAALRGGGGSLSTPPTNAPLTSDPQPNTTASDRNSPPLASPPPDPCPSAAASHLVTPSPLHPLTPLSDPFSTGELPTPPSSPLPSPSRTPEDIIAAALNAIQNPDTPCPDAGPITLYNLNGLISNRTQAHFDEYKRNLLKNWIKDAWRFKSAGELAPISYSTYSLGQRANTTVPITLHDGTILKFRFQLERQTSGTLANCWLLEHYICQFRDQANTS